MESIASINNIMLGVLALFMLVSFIRNFRSTQQYLRLGLILGAIVLMLDLSIWPLLREETQEKMPSIISELIAAIEVAIFFSVGLYCCKYLGLSGAPVLQKEGYDKEEYLKHGLLYSLIFSAYTAVLFFKTEPPTGETLERLLDHPAEFQWYRDIPLLVLLGARAAIDEEITYRLGLQNFIAKSACYKRAPYSFAQVKNEYIVTIIIVAAMWSFGHVGVINKDWLKLLQMFPIGIALGFIFKKYGVGMCIFIHFLFNLTALFLSL